GQPCFGSLRSRDRWPVRISLDLSQQDGHPMPGLVYSNIAFDQFPEICRKALTFVLGTFLYSRNPSFVNRADLNVTHCAGLDEPTHPYERFGISAVCRHWG